MATTTTLLALRQEVLRRLWPGRLPLLEDTTALGTTTTFTIGDAVFSSGDANAYDGVFVYVAELVGSGPAIGEVSRVTRGGYAASTGVFTVSPAFTAAVQSGTDLQFHYGVRPDEILQAVNRTQNGLFLPAYLPLSLADDGNMEDDNVTSWAAVGTPTTRVKTTTVGQVYTGIRALSLATDATAEGATSNNIDVTEDENLLISVALSVPTGSFQVVLYNVTAAANIRTVDTIDEPAWTEVRFTEPVPDNCEQVAIRILSDTATSTGYVGWVSVLSQDRRVYPVPGEIADATDIEHPPIWYLPVGSASEDTDSYMLSSFMLEAHPGGRILQDYRGSVSQRVEVGRVSAPLFLKFRRGLPDLSADTDTTEAPSDLVVEGALADLTANLGERTKDASLLSAAASHKRNYLRLLDQYGLGKPLVRIRSQHRRTIGGNSW